MELRRMLGATGPTTQKEGLEDVKFIPKSLSVAPNILRRILFLIIAPQFHFAPLD